MRRYITPIKIPLNAHGYTTQEGMTPPPPKKHYVVDGINLHHGIRLFILTLDDVMTIRKMCKSYNIIARYNLLSVKINNLSLGIVTGHIFYKEVLEEIFKRRHELEIMRVQKNTTKTWAWLVTPNPAQVEKIMKFKIFFRNAIIPTTIKMDERLTTTQLAKNLFNVCVTKIEANKDNKGDIA